MPEENHTSHEEGKSEDGVWEKTSVTYLYRYRPAGTYYYRVRFGRKKTVMRKLGTNNFAAAKILLSEKIADLKRVAPLRNGSAIETLHDALKLVRQGIEENPGLKTSSRRSALLVLDTLGPGGRVAAPATPLARLSSSELSSWWSSVAKVYKPQRSNHLLMYVRRALKIARDRAEILRDPSIGLRRVRIPRTRIEMLTAEQIASVIEQVRSQRKATSEQSANWIAFALYSGLRPGEIQALEWEHIDVVNRKVINVHGGEEGTKGNESRPVPIIPAMRRLLKAMKRGTGRIFTIKKPTSSLARACEKLQLPHLRVYDLRHTFASRCAMSGVDIPTISKWLGHKDGGELAMRTYIHTTDEHSAAAAKKVKF